MILDLTEIENDLKALQKQANAIRDDMARQANDSLGEIMQVKDSLAGLHRTELLQKIDQAINLILSKDYEPIIDVKVDNTEMITAIQNDNQSIIQLLTEIKVQLMKRATGFEFERDNQGFIKSPIKITY